MGGWRETIFGVVDGDERPKRDGVNEGKEGRQWLDEEEHELLHLCRQRNFK